VVEGYYSVRGAFERAALLNAIADTLRREQQIYLSPVHRAEVERCQAVRSRLSGDVWDKLRAEGSPITVEEVVPVIE
jgi:hypothetical protein